MEKFFLNVNSKDYEVSCDPDRLLIDILREDLRLTGTKRGCGIGVCGTCTVLIDDEPKMACHIKIKDVASRQSLVAGKLELAASDKRPATVVTIEGLEQNGRLHPIQQAFIDCGAIQCGFCTPGMVLAAKALLDKNPNPSREEIKKALARNLCRCTGYQQIFEAIETAAKQMNNP